MMYPRRSGCYSAPSSRSPWSSSGARACQACTTRSASRTGPQSNIICRGATRCRSTHQPPNVRVKCVPIEEEYAASYGSPDTWDGSKQEFKACWELVLGRRGLQLGSGRRRLRSKGAETLDDYGFIACSQLRGGSYVYSRIRPPINVSAVESRTQKD